MYTLENSPCELYPSALSSDTALELFAEKHVESWLNLCEIPSLKADAPTGGSISNFSATNGAQLFEQEHKGLQVYHSSRPALRDGESIVCTYDVTVSPEATEELRFMSTPTLIKYR